MATMHQLPEKAKTALVSVADTSFHLVHGPPHLAWISSLKCTWCCTLWVVILPTVPPLLLLPEAQGDVRIRVPHRGALRTDPER
jgi:hypothetical protein